MSSHGLALLIVAVLWAMVAFVVALDASRRGRHAGLWGLLTFLAGIFGAVLYVVVVVATEDPGDGADGDGGDPATVRLCPECSARHDGSPDYCADCGAELRPDDERPVGRLLRSGSRRYCGNCKSRVHRDADACPDCEAVF